MDKQILAQWHCFELASQTQRLPDQRERNITTLHHPGAVVILALDSQGQIIMERQYRSAIQQWLIELPAGTLEKHEQGPQGILACAQRELQEETNLQAAEWQALGKLYPVPGFCDEIQYLFVAKQLSAQAGQCDEDEFIEIFSMSCAEFEQAIVDGTINDAKSIACYTRAKLSGLLI
ncbi:MULTISPECIES: NUDIX hydrolase [unclassified Agarivorans]|uniref:NUDIX hydrolase n=1 Tax=unclassified Agarivorans TaxID=2636026 RepID=UPI003D7EAE6F